MPNENISVYGLVKTVEYYLDESVHKDMSGAFREEDAFLLKDIEMMRDWIDLLRTAFNFCSRHGSLNKRFCGNGVKQTVTPAMMMGITDDVWTLRRLMEFRYKNYVNQL